MVLAFAKFIISVCDNLVFLVSISYVAENFTEYAPEATGIMHFSRGVLGLLVPRYWDRFSSMAGRQVGWGLSMMAEHGDDDRGLEESGYSCTLFSAIQEV